MNYWDLEEGEFTKNKQGGPIPSRVAGTADALVTDVVSVLE